MNGEGKIKVDIPGLMSGPAGVGVGIRVYVKILSEILKDVYEEIKKAIKHYSLDVVKDILLEKFEKFKEEVKLLAEQMTDLGVDVITSVLDFIGKDLTAIDLKMKRHDSKLISINKAYMKNITAAKEDPSDEKNNKALEENKARLEAEFEVYNTYVEKAFGIQKKNIEIVIRKAADKVDDIQKKGGKSKDEAKAFKKAASKIVDTVKDRLVKKSW